MPYNPYALERSTLGARLFSNAGAISQMGGGFLSSRGVFDPNLEMAMRNQAFGGASQALAQGLAQLTSQEGGYQLGLDQLAFGREQLGEETRQFDINAGFRQQELDLMRKQFDAMLRAAQPGFFEYLTGIGGLAGGFGDLFKGLFGNEGGG